jgi:S-DNA-T family DNA segregation ATPase FtsK/SpoIIIE
MASRLLTFRGRGITTHTDAPAPVAPPEPPKPRPAHRPILPPWLRQRAELRNATHWAVLHVAHLGAFHGLRLPKYALRLAVYSPRGAFRALGSGARWLFDADGLTVQRHAITSLAGSVMGHERSGHVAQYRSLSKEHSHRVRGRLFVVAILVVFGLPALAALSPRIPALAAVVAVGLLGWHGRRKDRPIVDQGTIDAPGARPITPDMVVAAFSAAGLCKDTDPITFAAPGVARDGKGFAARVFLPIGTTTSKAVDKTQQIASGLDVKRAQVFLGPWAADGSERRVQLWVADTDPYAAKTPITPLAAIDTLDFWKGFPFGLTARGRAVNLSLVWSSLLVGAIPRMGKTNVARLVGAAAALDPYVKLIVADGKGGKDWSAFADVADWYGSGIRDGVVESFARTLKGLVDEMERRYTALNKLPDDRCPDGKVTPSICRDRRLNMPLVVVIVDEIQRLLEHKELGDTILELLVDLAKTGPAAGIMLVLATQKPDAQTLPDDLRGQIGTRFALRVMTYQASDTILGAGSYSAGLDASKIEEQHLGVGILRGAGDEGSAGSAGQTVRTHICDIPTLRKIVARGRELRIKAGTLTGMAAGEDVIENEPPRKLLDDVREIFAVGESKLWSETIASRLAGRWPDAYDGWTAADVGSQLGRLGIRTGQVWATTPDGTGANRKGVTLEGLADLQDAPTGAK